MAHAHASLGRPDHFPASRPMPPLGEAEGLPSSSLAPCSAAYTIQLRFVLLLVPAVLQMQSSTPLSAAGHAAPQQHVQQPGHMDAMLQQRRMVENAMQSALEGEAALDREEDELVAEARKAGMDWPDIAAMLPTRSVADIRKRFNARTAAQARDFRCHLDCIRHLTTQIPDIKLPHSSDRRAHLCHISRALAVAANVIGRARPQAQAQVNRQAELLAAAHARAAGAVSHSAMQEPPTAPSDAPLRLAMSLGCCTRHASNFVPPDQCHCCRSDHVFIKQVLQRNCLILSWAKTKLHCPDLVNILPGDNSKVPPPSPIAARQARGSGSSMPAPPGSGANFPCIPRRGIARKLLGDDRVLLKEPATQPPPGFTGQAFHNLDDEGKHYKAPCCRPLLLSQPRWSGAPWLRGPIIYMND